MQTAGVARGQTESTLRVGFSHPPAEAAPRVWYHWMDGDVDKAGIALDLDWMHRIGIGGFQTVDASLGLPLVVPERVVYMTPPWLDAFHLAMDKANALKLDVTIDSSPGWSEAGGPWVQPVDGMKKYVWSEVVVSGNQPFKGKLPPPPDVTGPLQGAAAQPAIGSPPSKLKYYADAAVFAYPLINAAAAQPKITASDRSFAPKTLGDGTLTSTNLLPAPAAGQSSWIQLTYPEPQRIQSATLSVLDPSSPMAAFLPAPSRSNIFLESSDDGKNFTTIVEFPANRSAQHTVEFPPVTARIFRLRFAPSVGGFGGGGDVPTHNIAEFSLHSEPRVNRFEEKAGFITYPVVASLERSAAGPGEAIPADKVIDLTTRMKPDGSLDWTPPPGQWKIVRLGYSLTGSQNGPAEREAVGLEVDKLDHAAVERYLNHYLSMYSPYIAGKSPRSGEKAITSILTDSWEAGVQNWTPEIFAKFRALRGYDMHPYLPVLTGQIVGSGEQSDRFLWDFRKTLSDLVATEYYATIDRILAARGLGRYGESHESGRAFIGDGMEVKKTATVPMGAMWAAAGGNTNPGYDADIRESSSVAHIYGRKLVGAESFTAIGNGFFGGAFAWSPEMLKPIADRMLALGVTRFSIHTSVHQPTTVKAPGLSLGQFGQWFSRNETWAEQAKPWIEYLGRSSYMLQQGTSVADILYFYGEDTNLTALFRAGSPTMPPGFNFDYVNADALIHEFSVRDGKIVSRSGTSYRVLVLDKNANNMSLPVLRAIEKLVNAGAVVAGERPVRTPSLADDSGQFDAIVNRLWGDANGVGNKNVHAGGIADALAATAVTPDVSVKGGSLPADILFNHRKLTDGDIYFVSNQSKVKRDITLSFRTTGYAPEIWHADTGSSEPVSYSTSQARTDVPLSLDAEDSVFVVFLKKAATGSRNLPPKQETVLQILKDDWTLTFAPDRGAPEKAMDWQHLGSWTERSDGGKYFSGTATYRQTFTLSSKSAASGRVMLDLGTVKDLAEVVVNGKSMGILWKAPFRVDITSALRDGDNDLEVRVTNLWVNRLIGDAQPGDHPKYAYTIMPFYRAESPLLPSGLLGPVRLLHVEFERPTEATSADVKLGPPNRAGS